MNSNKLSKLFSFETIYWFLLFALLLYLFCGNILSVDDIYYSFLADAKITLHREYFYGTWLMPLQNLLMYYLPYKLGINIQDWAQYFGAFLESSFIFILFWYYSKFFESAKVSKKMNLFLTSISFMLLFFLLNLLNFKDILIYSGFFRFVVPSVLLVVWCYYLYKIFKSQSFGTVGFIVFLLFSVLTASSSEVAGFMCIIFSFVLLVYSLMNKKECGKKLMVISAVLVLGLLILLLTKGFQAHFSGKIQNNILSFETVAVNFLPYLKACLKKLFPINGFLFVLLCILMFLNKRVENSKDEMIFSLSLFSAIVVFALSLVILGKTHYSGGYWIEHTDIYVFMYILYIVLIDVLLINILNQKSKKILLVCFFALLPLFFVSSVHLRVSINNIKDLTYLKDKMMMYYMSLPEQEKIILPYALYNNSFYTLIGHVYVDFNAFLNLYSRDFSLKDKEFLEMYKYSMYVNYYPFVYKFKFNGKNLPVEFIDGRSAMKIFNEMGGDYSEIKNHKYHFSDLEKKQ